jgi:hypothetical protein
LFEEGSFFRPHKNSEKTPGMIGTLLISLASKHEGGEIRLSHSDHRKTFATSSCSEFDLSALAWYPDVTHEIRPLTSGYRLVITYKLIHQAGAAASADLFMELQTQLQGLLQKWTSDLPHATRMIFRLDHKYSESSLALQNMKGRDAQIVGCLKQACQGTRFYLLLAEMTRTKRDPDSYHGDDPSVEGEILLDYVTSLDGSHIASFIDVERGDILGPDPYRGRRADSVDEGEFTGNKRSPSEYRYYDFVSLAVSP